jgi:Domain of Unknown Function (DUF1206)
VAYDDSSGGDAREQAQKAAKKASPWLVWFARAGYVAYGVVYGAVGVLALQAAFGGGGKTTSQEGAFRSILFAPLGRILLGLVAIGLLGYALWRLFQAIFDPDAEGADASGIATRLAHGLDGAFHLILAFTAGQLVVGLGGGGGGSPDDWTARLLAQPLGRWLAVIIGAAFVGAGLYQFYAAYEARFKGELKLHEMSGREKRWAMRSGRLGYAARGAVFGVIGIFLMQAALQTDPDKARGLGGALQALVLQPFGPYLLGAVALGLVAYGAFMLVVARYRRIEPSRPRQREQ